MTTAAITIIVIKKSLWWIIPTITAIIADSIIERVKGY